jgi:hypothetical protein
MLRKAKGGSTHLLYITLVGSQQLISDHVPFRNSKLTRMLQPSLSGDARISVVCTINPSKEYIAESTSTLLFAQRIKKVQVRIDICQPLGFSNIHYFCFSLSSMHRRKKLLIQTHFSNDTERKSKNSSSVLRNANERQKHLKTAGCLLVKSVVTLLIYV